MRCADSKKVIFEIVSCVVFAAQRILIKFGIWINFCYILEIFKMFSIAKNLCVAAELWLVRPRHRCFSFEQSRKA